MSYANRKRQYDILVAEAEGLTAEDKYHKIPQRLKDEFGDPADTKPESEKEIQEKSEEEAE